MIEDSSDAIPPDEFGVTRVFPRLFGKKSAYSAGFEAEPEIGGANPRLSRIIMFNLFDGENRLVAGVYEKRLIGRFSFPNRHK
jgi:hypothetical protein